MIYLALMAALAAPAIAGYLSLDVIAAITKKDSLIPVFEYSEEG